MSFPMPVLECPRVVREFADRFKDVVGLYYPEFVSGLCASLLGVSGLSDMTRSLAFSRSVSSLSRFFNSDLGPGINRRHRRQLAPFFEAVRSRPEDFLWVIDDTVLPHYGTRIWEVTAGTITRAYHSRTGISCWLSGSSTEGNGTAFRSSGRCFT